MVLFAGIDLGSTGIRGIIADSEGKVIINIQEPFPVEILYEGCEREGGRHEQNTRIWVEKINSILKRIGLELKDLGYKLDDIKAICSDSTSGTIVAVDDSGNPLIPAMMYNDIRAKDEAREIQGVTEEFSNKIGYKFKASFALPKMFWIKNNLPAIFKRTYKFLHANDFLVGLLSNEYFHSDSSNCLKAGYDFLDRQWPDFIERDVGISPEKLPEVAPPGKIVGKTSEKLEKLTGFPAGTLIVSGMTDSTMALIASGASSPGDIFSSLGTTLVTRVLSRELIRDPQGRVYCHVLPGKIPIYLPGGASSVGAECLQAYFPNVNYELYDQKALEIFPAESITYPLVKKGERFPFVNNDAEHFYQGSAEKFEKYTAYLQAVAFVERLSIETLGGLGAEIGDRVFTIGGAVKSKPWLQIRADVLQKPVFRPKIIEAAYGAAILAASTVSYNGNLSKTIEKFVQPDLILQPRAELRAKIEEKYHKFITQIRKRYQLQI
ncbi:MAG: FGGY-family carbohydrate kinase [Candidatus Helarchaeota archaeon]|nr:FGGY-family carbohydrate kinase [Candidatus Helarchaeota archaeon]